MQTFDFMYIFTTSGRKSINYRLVNSDCKILRNLTLSLTRENREDGVYLLFEILRNEFVSLLQSVAEYIKGSN